MSKLSNWAFRFLYLHFGKVRGDLVCGQTVIIHAKEMLFFVVMLLYQKKMCNFALRN